MFKKITNSFFGNPKGVIVDNSYDPYVLHQLIKYFTENKIEYLSSQDNDLSYLKHFKDVSFLSIPNEATNFDELNSLKTELEQLKRTYEKRELDGIMHV